MNVLLAATSTSNPLLSQLAKALAEHSDVQSVQHSLQRFQQGLRSEDVVHIHWPEALFENWQIPTDEGLTQLASRLRYWRQHASIVATVHNLQPHYREASIYRELYQLVYDHVDGLIHMGEASRGVFKHRYDLPSHVQETIIPHGRYSHFDDRVDVEQARARFGLDPDSFVCLSFGRLRDPEELNLLLAGFRALDVPDKHLLIAGKLTWLKNRWERYYYETKARLHRRVQLYPQFIPDEDVAWFLGAADTLVIPRVQVLNSGNVALAFTFGKVVVGPDQGVVGEILVQTGNPVFDSRDPGTLARALVEGRVLAKAGKGDENAAYGREYWNWKTIANQHVAFYHQLLDTVPPL